MSLEDVPANLVIIAFVEATAHRASVVDDGRLQGFFQEFEVWYVGSGRDASLARARYQSHSENLGWSWASFWAIYVPGFLGLCFFSFSAVVITTQQV